MGLKMYLDISGIYNDIRESCFFREHYFLIFTPNRESISEYTRNITTV